MRPLAIIHVLRAPVGGLFRHVVDLARGQSTRGHRVGLIADSTSGAAQAESVLAELGAELAFGVKRIAMSRHLGPRDVAATAAIARRLAETDPDVVHGHGAKGGAYARLPRRGRAIRVYTPHGGSLHYRRTSPIGLLYLGLERVLLPRTDLLIFESAYGRDVFAERIATPRCLRRVIHNGVAPAEFLPVERDPAATDLVFVGELRMLKGVDVLIDALALLARAGAPTSATIVGAGPDAALLQERARARDLAGAVQFAGPLPARTAFTRGRALVVPSRAESLPYIVLEAAAAGLPMIATRVGGIPEIFGPAAARLVAPDDAAALAGAIRTVLGDLDRAREDAVALQARVRAAFSVETMTEQVLAAYAAAGAPGDAALLRSS